MDALSRRIRDLRVDNDMKQGDMGSVLGITQNMVSNYENGREPPLDTVLLYARYFNVSIDYLLGLTNEKKPAKNSLEDTIAAVARLAGDVAPTASDIIAFLTAAADYYAKGAPCGDIPLVAYSGFMNGLRIAMEAASSEQFASVLDGTNAAISSALALPKMLEPFYNSKGK